MDGGSSDRPADAPRDDGAADAKASDASRAVPVEGDRGIVVLVVDDEAVIRAHVARALTLAGFDVAVAVDGREAIRLVADSRVRPAVVVTDIEMPGMTGIELAARLLAMRPALRIVMMTGDPDRADAARGHPSIVDAVLMKPIQPGELVDAVRPVGPPTRIA